MIKVFGKRWWWITFAAAATVTCVDAVLLQRSRSIFTGGFLSVDHLRGPAEIGLFFLLSLAVDIAVAGVLAALTLYLFGSIPFAVGTNRRAS